MVRMGTDLGLIKYIVQRFDELNFYTGEPLSIKELTQGACHFVNGQVRRRDSVQMKALEVVSEHEMTIVMDNDDSDTFFGRDSYYSETASFALSSGRRSSLTLQSSDSEAALSSASQSARRTRISFADELVIEEEEEKEEISSNQHPEMSGSSLSTATAAESSATESTFLRRLIDKFGIESSEQPQSCETTEHWSSDSDASRDSFADEILETRRAQGGINRVKRLMAGLKQECDSLRSQRASDGKRASEVAAVADLEDAHADLNEEGHFKKQRTASTVKGSQIPATVPLASIVSIFQPSRANPHRKEQLDLDPMDTSQINEIDIV